MSDHPRQYAKALAPLRYSGMDPAAWRAAVEASPHDAAVRGAYADWLEETHGDPDRIADALHALRHHDGPVAFTADGGVEPGRTDSQGVLRPASDFRPPDRPLVYVAPGYADDPHAEDFDRFLRDHLNADPGEFVGNFAWEAAIPRRDRWAADVGEFNNYMEGLAPDHDE